MRWILPSLGILLIALSRHIFVVAEVTEHEDVAKRNNTLTRNRRGFEIEDKSKALIAMLALLACGASRTDTDEEKKQKCKINVKELKLKHALIINSHDHSKFLYPDEDGNIYFDKDEPVFLSCGTNGNTLKLIPKVAYATFYCLCNKTFRLMTKSYNFNDLDCDYYPEKTVKYNEKDSGINQYQIVKDVNSDQEILLDSDTYKYQIGFKVDKSHENFVNLIDVYYDKEFKVTTYVKSEISKFIGGGQVTEVPKPYYPKNCCSRNKLNWIEIIDEIVQKRSFTIQIYSENSGSSEDHYIRPGTEYVFDYTTLTAPQSMVYSAAAQATYSKLNMAPQWKTVNHNWRCIENHVSKMAKVLKKNLLVYTGVYDGLKLVDKTDRHLKDVYLYAHREREMVTQEIPIAAYFFKMVIDFTTNSGVVYITVNNPYIQPGPEHEICTNACTSMTGVVMPENWEPTNPALGYSYMCKVDDFQDRNAIFIEDLINNNINKLLYIPTTLTSLPNTSIVRSYRIKDELK